MTASAHGDCEETEQLLINIQVSLRKKGLQDGGLHYNLYYIILSPFLLPVVSVHFHAAQIHVEVIVCQT